MILVAVVHGNATRAHASFLKKAQFDTTREFMPQQDNRSDHIVGSCVTAAPSTIGSGR